MTTRARGRRKSWLRHLAPSAVFTREDRATRLGWQGVLIVIGVSFFGAQILEQYGRAAYAWPTFTVAGSLVFAVWLRWRLAQYGWFWATIAVFLALNVLVVVLVPWTNKDVPRGVMAGAMTIDLYVLFVVLKFEERFFTSRRGGLGRRRL